MILGDFDEVELLSGYGAKSRDGWSPRCHDGGLGMVPDIKNMVFSE